MTNLASSKTRLGDLFGSWSFNELQRFPTDVQFLGELVSGEQSRSSGESIASSHHMASTSALLHSSLSPENSNSNDSIAAISVFSRGSAQFDANMENAEMTAKLEAASEASAASPGPARKKRVSKAYTAIQKTTYVDAFRRECSESGYTSQRQFARKNGLSHARFSAWCKEYDSLKSLDTTKQTFTRVRSAQPRFPVLETRVLDWVNSQRNAPNPTEPNVKSIQKAARLIARDLGMTDFMASNTWIERFKRRCNLHQTAAQSPGPNAETAPLPPSPDISPDDNFTTDIQDVLIDNILQDFLNRSTNCLATPIECAGLGLSTFPVSEKLKEIQIEGNELNFESEGSLEAALAPPQPVESTGSSSRVMYTPKQRMKYLHLYRTEKAVSDGRTSVRTFCERNHLSRTRMTAWLKQEASGS